MSCEEVIVCYSIAIILYIIQFYLLRTIYIYGKTIKVTRGIIIPILLSIMFPAVFLTVASVYTLVLIITLIFWADEYEMKSPIIDYLKKPLFKSKKLNDSNKVSEKSLDS